VIPPPAAKSLAQIESLSSVTTILPPAPEAQQTLSLPSVTTTLPPASEAQSQTLSPSVTEDQSLILQPVADTQPLQPTLCVATISPAADSLVIESPSQDVVVVCTGESCEASLSFPSPKDEVYALAACTEESSPQDEEAVAPVAIDVLSLPLSQEKREAPARVEEAAAFDESLLSCCVEESPPWEGEVIVPPLLEGDEDFAPVEEPLEEVPPPLPPEVGMGELFGSPMNVSLLFPPWEDEEDFVRGELPNESLLHSTMVVPPDRRYVLLRRKPPEDLLLQGKTPLGIMGSLQYLLRLLFPFLFLFSLSASERSWVDFPRACCPLFVGDARMRIRSRSDARIREGSGRRKKKGRESPRTREEREGRHLDAAMTAAFTQTSTCSRSHLLPTRSLHR